MGSIIRTARPKGMATAQDYLKNEKFVKCMGEFFTQVDLDESGYVSREDHLQYIANLAKAVPDNPDAIAKLRKVTLEFIDELGLTEGLKADKQKYLELAAAMAVNEMAKVRKREITLFENQNDALFDVVDRSRNGRLTFEEYKVAVSALNFDENSAKATFDMLDRNKDGTIERKEFIAANINFWLACDDPNCQGMFGDKFE